MEGSAVIIVFAVLFMRKESIVLRVFGFQYKSITLAVHILILYGSLKILLYEFSVERI